MKARVIVTLLADIPDSQGETVTQAIADAGHDSVTSTRQGKVFDFEIEAEDRAAVHAMLVKISRDVLADLETEDFLVRVEASDGETDRRGGERRDAQRRADDNRRTDEDRRSGRDRRADAAAARGEERREGSDRRDRSDRRSGDRRDGTDRRALDDRRDDHDRRSGDERRSGRDDFDGAERRSVHRRAEQRRSDNE